MRIRKITFVLSVMVMAVAMTGCVKVVKIGEEESLIGSQDNAAMDVEAFWDTQALPEIEASETELAELLNNAAGDLKSQDAQGRYTMGDSGDLNFAVRGTGTVTEVDTSKQAGTMAIKVDGYDGNTEVRIQIGSVYKQTSIRDYLSFLDVNNYGDQIEFAQLNKNITKYIDDNIISTLDVEGLSGKKIKFSGCFTYKGDDSILITPVALSVE